MIVMTRCTYMRASVIRSLAIEVRLRQSLSHTV